MSVYVLSQDLPFVTPQVELCEACIKWAQDENRVFLRQALQSRLVAVYVDSVQYTAALSIAAPLLKELKKIDDKALLVEVIIVLYCTMLHTIIMNDTYPVPGVPSKLLRNAGSLKCNSFCYTSHQFR